ncbi:MAG TPA: energy transducer TonB [Edaphobacter sp.]|jgi:protein TonB|nr:energy transducer TonB [Edaphobacter sp.]
MRDQIEEFEMLLDDVLREVANPEPGTGLQQRVMIRLEMAAEQASELRGIAEVRLLNGGTKQESILGSLWSGLRELVLPNRLSPLVLESRPVAVVDRMFERRSYRSAGWAVVAHVFAVLMVGFAATTQIHFAAPGKTVTELVVPPQASPRTNAMHGGGGQRGSTPVTKGTPPKFAEQQIVAPKEPPMIEPKIHIEPSLEVQQDVRMASSIPQIGVATSPLVGMSMGSGRGNGLGSGNGNGVGPGSGGNTGGGVRQIGGGVSAPVLLYQVDPEFSEEARRSKTAGNVLVNLWVDEKGNPTHVHVIRGIGMGLDEKAVAAVKLYKFKPAMENGRPVTVEMNVEVTFHIF